MLPSPRNSIDGLLSLLKSTKCRYLLSAPENKVDHILAKWDMQHIVVKTFDDWVAQESVTLYIKDKGPVDNDPFIVIHTSGSTGQPKPTTLYQGGLATVDISHLMPLWNGYTARVTLRESQS